MPDPIVSSSDAELRAHVERALAPHYELDREIGRGGMGIVYRALDRRLKRNVAIKLLPPELAFRGEIRSRFLREAATAAQLSHPSIVPIHSVDEKDNLVYFIMAYVDGDNLAKRLHDRGRLPIEETRRIVCEVADALAFAHARGVIHRDIKPDNILLDAENGRAMVTDFGIARAITDGGDSRLTATGTAIGTPAYMSPEQCAGDRDIDGRSDLYSLGVVTYQMLAGELPFSAPNTPMMLVKHISEQPTPVDDRRSDIPPDMARAVMMLLEKEPASRFPSASALVAALQGGEMPPIPVRTASAAPARSTWTSSPAPYQSPQPSDDGVTLEEIQRWNEPEVQAFRRKAAMYGFLAPVLILIEVLTNNGPFGFLAVIGTIYIVFKYARLWTNGFDWRDVLKQPRDRLFADVTSEAMDDVRALWDPEKRKEVRDRTRLRARQAPVGRPPLPAGRPAAVRGRGAERAPENGPYARLVQSATRDRDEIVRQVEGLPRGERERVAEVIPSAFALQNRIIELAISLAESDRELVPGAVDTIEAEIEALEARANPLEAASEDRVRRLAFLKRQRRGAREAVRRRDEARAALDQCALALETMRYDIVRLRAGTQTPQGITLLAEQALSLARDVDHAVAAADQVSRLTRAPDRGGPTPRSG